MTSQIKDLHNSDVIKLTSSVSLTMFFAEMLNILDMHMGVGCHSYLDSTYIESMELGATIIHPCLYYFI